MSANETPTGPSVEKTYWRSLDQLAETPEYREHLDNEFPKLPEAVGDAVSRRNFMGIMGAAMAMSGLVGCRRPLTKILPYAKMPEEILPGVPVNYASMLTFGGIAQPVVVEAHEGRPVKIEGNKEHPASLGATSVFTQASILDMYTPDRLKTVQHNGTDSSWDAFRTFAVSAVGMNGGQGVRFLTAGNGGPTQTPLRTELEEKFPGAVWHTYEPVNRDNAIEGARAAFGRPLRQQLRLEQADVILALDSDFLYAEPNSVQLAKQFASRRRVASTKDAMNRLYAVEAGFSVTGAMADNRLRMAHAKVGDFLRALALELNRTRGVSLPGFTVPAGNASWTEKEQKWVSAVAKDLAGHNGRAVILVGAGQDASVHALAHALNQALGAHGSVVRFTEEPETPNQTASIMDLAQAMGRGAVETLIVIGGNPVFDAPADASVWDGRFANNGWMQELPDPMTKLTWDNAALVSPKTAEAQGLASGDMVTLTAGGRSLTVPVWVNPGQPETTITLALGYGRTTSGTVGTGRGFNTYTLRTAEAMHRTPVTLAKAGGTYLLASTQHHHTMDFRALAREATVEHYHEHPDFAEHMEESPPLKDIYIDREYDFTQGMQWGMSIDHNTCIACNACAIACQSENNIAIVGKEQVHRGREMHWIRLDRYYTGDVDEPTAIVQPLNCMQCENAPCESVCPVAATTHSSDGLNDMVYNRCIGTRYCNNNCPYKVRRFNFFDWNGKMPESEKMAKNPDVTVRMRGVMEKCTYCVQRISRAKITAKNEGRLVRDGEIETACQQVCPTDSIVFGNINDPESRVAKLKAQDRDYSLLSFLNTRPRTTYLAGGGTPSTTSRRWSAGPSKPRHPWPGTAHSPSPRPGWACCSP